MTTTSGEQAMEECKHMSVRDIKAELDRRGVKYSDLFEKSDFVQRLVQARGKDAANVDHSASSESARKSTVDNVDHVPRGGQASSTPDQAIRKEVETMPLAAIRSELSKLGVSTQGAFEKREFVDLLCKARAERKAAPEPPPAASRSSEYRDVETKKMPREPQPGAAPQQQRQQPSGNPFAGGMPDM
eukprot:CAMPEP_0172194904 /NCGR_PEP_ID=MMETSP1050-20130122/25876_1 /TAXON_ID=233186 /ORGANISM="Cryptomonas curvata, Strain CCAP979/52" /LENGTH=186 /DNA_ID=CAMNT_0012870837 /DNA_START=97 /DNA_END=654 /DNA_ORIENTATION=+